MSSVNRVGRDIYLSSRVMVGTGASVSRRPPVIVVGGKSKAQRATRVVPARASLCKRLLLAALVFEGDLDPRPVARNRSVFERQVEPRDLGAAQISKRPSCLRHGGRGCFLPGFGAGTDEL